MDQSLGVFLVLSSSIIGLVYLYLTWNFKYWKNRNVKGPKPVMLFGNLPSIITRHRNINFEVEEIYEKFKKSGNKLAGIFITRNPAILILDPILAREILTNKFRSFACNELSLWCNTQEQISVRHIFNICNYEEWKEKRSDLMSGLTDSKLQQTYPILIELNHKMSNVIKSEISKTGGIIEIESLSYKYTIEFIANFVYGIEANVLVSGTPRHPIFEYSRNLMDLSFEPIEQFYLIGLMPRLKKFIKNRFFDEETDNYFIDIQKVAADMRLKNKNDRFDFLNYLLKLQEKKNLSDIDVVVHSISVVMDAVDSVAFVIKHTLFLLAYNQRAQNKLRMEINANMNDDGEVDFKTLMKLEYLEQCINESIRIFSPNTLLSKICTQETYLENNASQSIKIEPGMVVHISSYSFHHDPEIYPEPEQFIPERFDNGQAKILVQKGQFLPFSDGPRICSGMRLAQMQCKAGLYELVKKFHIKTCSRTQHETYEKYVNRKSKKYYLDGDMDLEFILL